MRVDTMLNEDAGLADGGVDEGAAADEDGLGGGEADEEERELQMAQTAGRRNWPILPIHW